MTIDDLKKINAVIETGSINKAAEKLFIAQPALSRCIRRIEEEYNIVLFERDRGKKIVLTKEGEIFVHAAAEILLVHDNMVSEIERHRQRDVNRVIFGTAPQQAIFLYGNMMREFYMRYPQFWLETVSGSTRTLHNDVLNGQIDIALINTSEFYDSLYYEKETRMITLIYAAKGSSLPQKAAEREDCWYPVVTAEDLRDEKFVLNYAGSASRRVFDQIAAKYDLHPEYEEEQGMYPRMKMADDGIGSYLLSAARRTDNLLSADRSRLVQLAPEQDVECWRYLVCRKGYEATEVWRAVRNCLKQAEKTVKEIS